MKRYQRQGLREKDREGERDSKKTERERDSKKTERVTDSKKKEFEKEEGVLILNKDNYEMVSLETKTRVIIKRLT